jgi:hypothetical protein
MGEAPEAAIPALLFKHLEDLTFAPPLPIAWPDVPFDPPAGPWLAVDFLPNRNISPFVGHRASVLMRGIFQVAVISPRGAGELASRRIAAAIVAHFAAGTPLRPADESFTLQIDGLPSVGASIQEEKWTRTPVTVLWHTFAA